MVEKDFFTPRMPEVDIRPDLSAIFDRARSAAANPHSNPDGVEHRQVIIITPGRLLLGKDCPLAGDIPVEQLAILGELVPPEPHVNITVIAYTFIDALKVDIRRAIPFFDFLLGFAALGHTVWVFEGHPSALHAGCENADLLLVDDAMLPFLEESSPDWRTEALSAMRGDTIKIIARLE